MIKMAMMRIAGKKANGTAAGVRVNNDGILNSIRVLDVISPTVILDETALRDTEAIDTTAVECDVYKYPVNSIVIKTSLDAAVNAILQDGSYLANTGYMRKLDGSVIQFDIPAKTGQADNYFIITADDLPEIDYIRFLKLRLQAKDTPTEGTIKIMVVHKG